MKAKHIKIRKWQNRNQSEKNSYLLWDIWAMKFHCGVELSSESQEKWKASNQQDVLLLNAADSYS